MRSVTDVRSSWLPPTGSCATASRLSAPAPKGRSGSSTSCDRAPGRGSGFVILLFYYAAMGVRPSPVSHRSVGTGVRPRHGADPKVAEADPVTSLGRCREPLVSGEREAAGSVLALPDGDSLVDGEVSVLESEHAGCEVEQPRACAGWGDEPLSVLP